MKLIKFSIIVFVFASGPCLGKLKIANADLEKSTSRLVNELGNILKRCYGDRISGVGLAGNLPSTLSGTLTVRHSIPAVVIDVNMNSNNMPRHLTNDFQYKLHVFVIEGYSTKQLDGLIGKMKTLVWWNHMASFFVLDLSRGCGNAKGFLLLAWKHDMLNAKVICGPGKSGRVIFNYNPFTSRAPVSWQRTKVFPATHKHPFTLLSRKYRENETICADLDFDKTKELGRYRIILEGTGKKRMEVAPLEVRSEIDQFLTIRENILRNVCRALNATVRFNGRNWVWAVITETDMIAHTVRIGNVVHKKMSYPTGIVGRGIITRFRNREPRRFNESFTVRGIDTWFGSPIVYLIAVLVLKFFLDQALVPELLNLIRVPSNTRLINLRNINPMRVYLADVGFFAVMMQAILYANLTYPLTTQIPLRNVETLQDLVDLSYPEVYGLGSDQYFYETVGPKKVYKNLAGNKCIDFLKKPTQSIACMADLYSLLDRVDRTNLHLSREIYEKRYESFPIRSNWPLEERVNTMLARSVEADILEPWYLKFDLARARLIRKGETDRNDRNVESIKLGEIIFAFRFLVIGHICATVVLIIEIVWPYKLRCKIRFFRRYWVLERKKNGCVSLTSKRFDLTV